MGRRATKAYLPGSIIGWSEAKVCHAPPADQQALCLPVWFLAVPTCTALVHGPFRLVLTNAFVYERVTPTPGYRVYTNQRRKAYERPLQLNTEAIFQVGIALILRHSLGDDLPQLDQFLRQQSWDNTWKQMQRMINSQPAQVDFNQ